MCYPTLSPKNPAKGWGTELRGAAGLEPLRSNRTFIVTTPAEGLEGEAVGCSICTHLACALESRHREYMTTCSETYRRVSSQRMAYAAVEMERARSELETHRRVCVFAVAEAAVRRS